MLWTTPIRCGRLSRVLLSLALVVTALPLGALGSQLSSADAATIFLPGAVWPDTPQPFWNPTSCAVDSVGEVLYTVDSRRNVVVKSALDGSVATSWGGTGAAIGRFNDPHGIALGPDGLVYVADTGNNRVQVFTSSGDYVRSWGVRGAANGEFNRPLGIAVTATTVYVSDTYNYRIQRFTLTGGFLGSWGSEGVSSGRFSLASGIAVDASDYVYVADTNNNRIQKFTPTGSYVRQWGPYEVSGVTVSRFNAPIGVAVDGAGKLWVADTGNRQIERSTNIGGAEARYGTLGGGDLQLRSPNGLAVSASGDVFIADTDNSRIQVWSSTGGFIRNIGADGTAPGRLRSPQSIARDSSGNFYVADSANNRVQKFDSTGGFIASWGESGTAVGQFVDPRGVAVDATGTVWVVDSGNKRVQQLSSTGEPLGQFSTVLAGDPESGKDAKPRGIAVDAAGTVYVSDVGYDRIQVHTTDGSPVRTWGSTGAGAGQLNDPNDIALRMVGGTLQVIVADTGNSRLQVFLASGTLDYGIGSFGVGQAEFRNPSGVAVGPGGTIYVADTVNDRVQQLQPSGQFLAWDADSGVDVGSYRAPVDVVADAMGDPVVLERDNHRAQVSVIDREGPHTFAWGRLGDWVNSSVDVTLSATDDRSAVEASYYRVDGGADTLYGGPVIISDEGVHAFEYWSRDAAGQVESPPRLLFATIDLTKPTVSSNVEGGGSYAFGHTVVLSATDALSGVQGVEYRIGAGAFTPYTGPFQLLTEGAVTLEFRAVDRAGNVSDLQSRSVFVEDPIPSTLSNIDGEWHPGSVEVTLGVASSLSYTTFYRVGTSAVQTYTAPFTVSDEGVTPVEYWSEGLTARESTNTQFVRIDRTPPLTAPGVRYAPFARSAVVTAPAEDTGSGVARTEYRIGDGSDWAEYSRPLDFDTVGQFVVWFRSVDKVGNIESPKSVIVTVEAPPAPSTTVNALSNVWYRKSRLVSFTATQSAGDPVVTYYRFTGDTEPTLYTGPFVVASEGVTAVEYWSEAAGVTEDVKRVDIHIDRTNPRITYLKSPTHPSQYRYYRSHNVRFVWRGYDRLSRVRGYSFVLDRRPRTVPPRSRFTTKTSVYYRNRRSGTWYFHVRARDNAGNWGPTRHYRVRIR